MGIYLIGIPYIGKYYAFNVFTDVNVLIFTSELCKQFSV